MTLTKLQFLMYFLGAILFIGRANQQLLVKFPSLHDTLVVSHGWPGPIFRVPQQTYLSLSTTGYTSITARQLSSGNVMFSVVSVHHSVHEGLPALAPPLPSGDETWDPPTHQTWDPPGPSPSTAHYSASDIWWWSLETCSNSFIWDPPTGNDI